MRELTFHCMEWRGMAFIYSFFIVFYFLVKHAGVMSGSQGRWSKAFITKAEMVASVSVADEKK